VTVYDPPLLDHIPAAGAHVATPTLLTGTSAHSVVVFPPPVAVKLTVPEDTGLEPAVVVEVNDPVAGNWISPEGPVMVVVVEGVETTTGSTITPPGFDVEAAYALVPL
jgi:hypothetical protein